VTRHPYGWQVAYALAKVDANEPVASWLRLAVAHAYEAGGCPSCGR